MYIPVSLSTSCTCMTFYLQASVCWSLDLQPIESFRMSWLNDKSHNVDNTLFPIAVIWTSSHVISTKLFRAQVVVSIALLVSTSLEWCNKGHQIRTLTLPNCHATSPLLHHPWVLRLNSLTLYHPCSLITRAGMKLRSFIPSFKALFRFLLKLSGL